MNNSTHSFPTSAEVKSGDLPPFNFMSWLLITNEVTFFTFSPCELFYGASVSALYSKKLYGAMN
jgi:hypothetical protein